MKEKTLAELANENFSSAWILKKHNINFFDESKSTVEDVCKNTKIDGNNLLIDLSQANIEFNNEEIDLDFLIDYMEKSRNKYLNNSLSNLRYIFSSNMANDAEFYKDFIEVFELLTALEANFKLHLHKEKYFLFPNARKETILEETSPEQDLQKIFVLFKEEQNFIKAILNRIEELVEMNALKEKYQSTLKILNCFVKNFKEYLQLENKVLFPKMELL
ncbi:hypothetical protein [Aureivirga marina]|uniref:hypothetical protein n=1 Tax=Aureivirga marina TaxID=1182451 RepID=UPI0018CBAB00|nr:hypothetical protein [Aureivirga marina]